MENVMITPREKFLSLHRTIAPNEIGTFQESKRLKTGKIER